MEYKELNAARATIPDGYGVVRSGAILPDDLCYVWPGGGWLRYDSPEWSGAGADRVEDAVLVIRSGRSDFAAYGPPRRYTIRRHLVESDIVETPNSALLAGTVETDQLPLF